jgi:hypothetical protein
MKSQRTIPKVSGLFQTSAELLKSQQKNRNFSGHFPKSADFSKSQLTKLKFSYLFEKVAEALNLWEKQRNSRDARGFNSRCVPRHPANMITFLERRRLFGKHGYFSRNVTTLRKTWSRFREHGYFPENMVTFPETCHGNIQQCVETKESRGHFQPSLPQAYFGEGSVRPQDPPKCDSCLRHKDRRAGELRAVASVDL